MTKTKFHELIYKYYATGSPTIRAAKLVMVKGSTVRAAAETVGVHESSVFRVVSTLKGQENK